MTQSIEIGVSAYEFLLMFHSSYVLTLHRFWNIVRCWSKIANLNQPTSIWRSRMRWRWNFAEMFGIRILEYLGYRMGLFAWSYVQLLWYSAGLWWTNGPTDRTDIIYRASIASRRKNHMSKFHQNLCTCYLWSWLDHSLKAMRYLLPVLWMTSFFIQWSEWARIEDDAHLFRPNRQVTTPGEKSAAADCIFLFAVIGTMVHGREF